MLDEMDIDFWWSLKGLHFCKEYKKMQPLAESKPKMTQTIARETERTRKWWFLIAESELPTKDNEPIFDFLRTKLKRIITSAQTFLVIYVVRKCISTVISIQ